MENLQLSLIEVWFKKTESLIKKEDYREITPYWCNRFLLFNGEKKPKLFWQGRLQFFGAQNIIESEYISFQYFETNTMTLGYPKTTDTDRILKYEHAGIEIGYGVKEWGAEPSKIYFVIKHGNKIN